MIDNIYKQFKTYRITGIKGVSDLKSINPYHGEWATWSPAYDITEEEYLKDTETYRIKVAKMNDDYINQLMASGEYGKEYHTDITLRNLPEWDDPYIKQDKSMESYRMEVLDFTKDVK